LFGTTPDYWKKIPKLYLEVSSVNRLFSELKTHCFHIRKSRISGWL